MLVSIGIPAVIKQPYPYLISETWLPCNIISMEICLYAPRHLILPLVFPGVHVSMIFTIECLMYLILTLILNVDFSVYLAGLADFDCGLFRLSGWSHWFWLRIVPFIWLNSLILTADCSFIYCGQFDYWYLNLKGGSRWVWPVSRECSLLRGTWFYLRTCRGSVLPYTRFCNCLLD
jgi:hypothetical protein